MSAHADERIGYRDTKQKYPNKIDNPKVSEILDRYFVFINKQNK